MAKFRRKPLVIEAQQFFRHGIWPKGVCSNPYCDGRVIVESVGRPALRPHVHTVHKGQLVELEDGDWVLAEADGKHHYAVKPEDMERLYDRVDE